MTRSNEPETQTMVNDDAGEPRATEIQDTPDGEYTVEITAFLPQEVQGRRTVTWGLLVSEGPFAGRTFEKKSTLTSEQSRTLLRSEVVRILGDQLSTGVTIRGAAPMLKGRKVRVRRLTSEKGISTYIIGPVEEEIDFEL